MYRGTKREVITVILLSIVTCGIYGLYWYYTTGGEINNALNKEAVKPVFVIIGIFCFPILLYYIYTMDLALIEMGQRYNRPYASNFMLWIITCLLGIGFLLVFIQAQTALNDMWDSVDGGTIQ